jgi:hypothetical protein
MGAGDHGVQQIDRCSCQHLVEQVRHQADGDTARPPAEQRPGQQIAANANFPGPDGPGSLHPDEPGVARARGPAAHAGELGSYPHRPAVFTARAVDGTTGGRVPTRVVLVVAGRPISLGICGIRGYRCQAWPRVRVSPSAHQTLRFSGCELGTTDQQMQPWPAQFIYTYLQNGEITYAYIYG